MTEVSGISETPKEATSIPERLSNEQLGSLIAAMGNSEVKVAMLIGMQKGKTYRKGEFKRLSQEMQRGYNGWDLSRGAGIGYAKLSFTPHGLVVEGSNGYIKSSYGENVGDPAGGNLLLFSSRHPNRALVDFFSVSSAPDKKESKVTPDDVAEQKKRAPATRIKILWELATAELPLQQTEVTKRVGELDEVVRRHLEELDALGIIIYEQPKKGNQPYLFYKLSDHLPEGDPEAFQGHVTLTRAIYNICKGEETRWWTAGDIEKEYIRITSEVGAKKETVGTTSIKELAPRILHYLSGMGYVEKKEILKGVNLTPEQRAVLVDLVTVLDGIQRQDPQIVQQGRNAVNFFLTHPDQIAALFAKAKEHSPYANDALPEDIANNILNLLSLHPGADSNSLQILLGKFKDEKMHLGKDRVNQILRSLIDNGDIEFSLDRGVRKYILKKSIKSEEF